VLEEEVLLLLLLLLPWRLEWTFLHFRLCLQLQAPPFAISTKPAD
jgi:hypothetical protein